MAHKIYYSPNTNSYCKVREPENVLRATNNTMRGKKKRYDVQRFMSDGYIEGVTEIWELFDQQKFVPSPYADKTIFDNKERHLKIAPLKPDKIVHHCLIDVIEPDLLKLFIANTYACVKGRGIHRCLNDLNRALKRDKRGTQYCLKTDIHHYYDSIAHEVLKRIIAKYWGDKLLLWLMYTIIDSIEGGVGLPIGFLTSQHFANLYLTPFDHWVKEVLGNEVKRLFGYKLYYYRYMDDMTFLCGSKPALHYVFERMQEYLNVNLLLTIKSNWQIFPVDARSIDFVGYKSNHYNVLARKSILYNYWRKLKAVQRKNGFIEFDEVKQLMAAHYGWLQHCSKAHFEQLLKMTLQQIREHNKMALQRLHLGLHSDSVQPTFDVVDRVKGTTLYNFNQHYVEATQTNADGKEESVKVNEYNSLLVDYPVTANTILQTLIEAKYSNDVEKKLINDYNAAVAGIEDESKKQPYLDFLAERKALRAMIDADCTTNGIPLA